MSLRTNTMRSQAGFTLVELAIVMIIIGLLIGGVLKGQELIGNAQVTATVAQLKGIEAATSTFRDTYAALPGDITAPTTRLPNCGSAPCSTAGNGDGMISSNPTAAPTAVESQTYFVHLNAANLLTGVVPGTDTFGGNFPQAKLNGNGVVAYGSTGAIAQFPAILGTNVPSRGTYLVLTNSPTAAPSGATVGMKPSEALRIDTKLDDGDPGAGEVRGFGASGADGCGTAGAGGASGTYATSVSSAQCGLYVHAQG